MSKKIISILLFSVMILMLSGCYDNKNNNGTLLKNVRIFGNEVVSPDGVHYWKSEYTLTPRIDNRGKHIIDNMITEYPLSTIVVEVDRKENLVITKDFNGNVWTFSECEDWAVNDICAMIISDNATANIYDDEIITVRYCGYIK